MLTQALSHVIDVKWKTQTTLKALVFYMNSENEGCLDTQKKAPLPRGSDSFWPDVTGAVICSIFSIGFLLWFTDFGFHPFLWAIFTVVPAFMFLAGTSLNIVEEIFIFTLWTLLVLVTFSAAGSLSSAREADVKEWTNGIQRFRIPILVAGLAPLITGRWFRWARWKRSD